MTCYICYESERGDDPLKSPCRCKGSIKYVHESCLGDWLRIHNDNRCRHCHYEYQTEADTPKTDDSRLPGKPFYEPILRMFTFYIKLILSACILINIHIFLVSIGSYASYIIHSMLLMIFINAIMPILRNYGMMLTCYRFANTILTAHSDSHYVRLLWWFMFSLALIIYPDNSRVFTDSDHILALEKRKWRQYAKTIKNYEH